MSLHLERFHDWPVALSGFEDREPRILDLELARKLGFARPRKIRELIERLSPELPGIQMRPTVGRGKMQGKTQETVLVDAYWLTVEEALFVTARSETPIANAILKAVIKVFLSAKDAIEQRYGVRVSGLAKLMLSASACEWDMMWPPDFVQSICKLHGGSYDGGIQPAFLASTYEKIYRLVLSEDVYREMKLRNPIPQMGTNHHQWLTPAARDSLRLAIPVITRFANHSGTKEQFWAHMEHEYGGKMLQLVFS